MSRIYHNQPLQYVPVITHEWCRQWDPKSFQSGNGVLLEGKVEGRSRHVIVDKSQQKTIYVVIHVKSRRAHSRQFDKAGKEIEPNFSETQKVSTGYLPSSYKTEAKGDTDKLTDSQLTSSVACVELNDLTQKYSKPNSLPFWIEENQLEKLEITDGDEIRIKTRGNSPFIESIAKIDTQSATVGNYAGGEEVGGSWTDKVMSFKEMSAKPLPQDQNEGVDEDEWDD